MLDEALFDPTDDSSGCQNVNKLIDSSCDLITHYGLLVTVLTYKFIQL